MFQRLDTHPDVAVVHSRAELTKDAPHQCRRNDPQQSAIAKTLFEIPGVAVVVVAAYEVVITKAALYTWDELQKPILDVVWAYNVEHMPTGTDLKQ